MDWEVVNGITGAISAISGIGGFAFYKKSESTNSAVSSAIKSNKKIASFIIACAGWALCCLCVLWIFEPFGSYPLPTEYRQFYGVILSFPGLFILFLGLRALKKEFLL